MNAWNEKNGPTPVNDLTADPAPENDSLPGESFTGPNQGAPLESPGTDIVTPDTEPDEIQIDVPNDVETQVTHFGRAVQVVADEVVNVLRVVLDEDDNVVGFEPDYGSELIVVDEDSMVSVGYIRVDGEFVSPDAE